MGGTDDYENLVMVSQDVHKLIHASTKGTIEKYKIICNLNKEQMEKLNNLHELAVYAKIV